MTVLTAIIVFLFLAELISARELSLEYGNAQDFSVLSRSKLYVNKSKLLSDFINNNDFPAIYLAAPRRFGKSTNNEMLRVFFDIQFKEDGYTLESDKTTYEYYDTFKSSNAVTDTVFFEKHFGNYLVFYMVLDTDWHVNSSSEFVINDIVYKVKSQTFGKYSTWWRESGVKINICEDLKNTQISDDYTCCSVLTASFDGFHLETRVLVRALRCLFDHLQEYYDRKIILIVDEFDYPVLRALRRLDSKSAECIMNFLNDVFGGVTKYIGERAAIGRMQRSVFKTLFTGITHLPIGHGSSRMNHIVVFNYFEYNSFSEHYGFSKDEVHKLLADFGILDKKKQVEKYYEGYHIIGSQLTIYNPWSISRFLQNNAKISSYWRDTATSDEWFHLFYDCEIFKTINLLAYGEHVQLESSVKEKISDFECMSQVFHLISIKKKNSAQITIFPKHRDYFFKYLLQEGYLNMVGSNSYAVPNIEVRGEFETMIREYTNDLFNFNKDFKERIADIFWDIAECCHRTETDEEQLSTLFNEIFQGHITTQANFTYNEQLLRTMIYLPCVLRTLSDDSDASNDQVFIEISVKVAAYTEIQFANGTTTKLFYNYEKPSPSTSLNRKPRKKKDPSGRVDVYFKLDNGKTILIVEAKCASTDKEIDEAIRQVLKYRPLLSHEEQCERLMFLLVVIPSCSPSLDVEFEQKMLNEGIKVTIRCYIIDNFDVDNLHPIARECDLAMLQHQ